MNLSSIFVFGSNLSGWHGAGAALVAKNSYGARLGIGVGKTGNAYAIPTKDCVVNTLPLEVIREYAEQFVDYAHDTQHKYQFLLSAIGCGLAGYQPEQIAPLFSGIPQNVLVSVRFAPWFPNHSLAWEDQ